jgi:DNA invertase Pin-like site-specific DNA recombinase
MEKVNEIERQITDCLATLEGLVTLLDAASVYPSTDPADYQRMFGGLQILATKAEQQIEEIEFAEVFKNAPAPEATGTSAEIKKDHIEVSTITPKPSTEIYQEVVEMLKKQIPAEDIAYKTRVPITQVYKIKGDIS